jgi:hypothetical protein
MTSIAIRSPSLEDVFIYLTGKMFDAGQTDQPAPGGRRRIC